MSERTEEGLGPWWVEREQPEIRSELRRLAALTGPEKAGEVVEALVAAMEMLGLEHGDHCDEPYEGAGYCTCSSCQRYRPAMSNAGALILRLLSSTEAVWGVDIARYGPDKSPTEGPDPAV